MDFTSEVAVSVKRSPAEALKTAFSKLSVPIVPPKNTMRTVIKPSIYNPSLPGNTDVAIVRAVTRMFGSLGPVHIVESDNPLRTADDAFSRSGYDSVKSENVELVNLSDADMVNVTFPGNFFNARMMPAILSPGGFLISVATLKAEPEVCTIGAGIKNLFGLLPEVDKSIYHKSIDNVLIDILSIYRPQLSIIDLTQMTIGDRAEGRVRHIGGVIVGTDPVSVDAFGATLLGYDPLKIPYLKTAYELGFGEALPDLIRVKGTQHQIDELERRCII
ncbi:MAG: DUF362 domain-containing protein [Candidatus Thorarchaeota archaeon]